MELKDYCRAMETELTGWKDKIYDVGHGMNKLDCAEREKILSIVGDLHILFSPVIHPHSLRCKA